MFPYQRMPCHITVLYIITVVNLVALFHVTLVDADVLVNTPSNETVEIFKDMPAQFGPQLPTNGMTGYVVYIFPRDACHPINPPPANFTAARPWVALIRRGNCDFDRKVITAQKAGYDAAIVFNDQSNELIPMYSYDPQDVTIPSVFVGLNDGLQLVMQYQYISRYYLTLTPDPPLNFDSYLLPFAVVVGICFVIMLIFMVAKCVRDHRRKRRSRLSVQHLKRIPTKKFKKGDEYDMCAICLDEYDDGEKLRILPCTHAYHVKCIDPWLTNNKKTCPVCKRQVIPGDESDNSDSESGGEGDGETTPLLQNARAIGSSTFYTSGRPVDHPISSYQSSMSTESADTLASTDTAGPPEFVGHRAPSAPAAVDSYFTAVPVGGAVDALSMTSDASTSTDDSVGRSTEQVVTVNVYPPPINNTETAESSSNHSSPQNV